MRLAATRSWIRLWRGAESLWSAGVCAAAGQRRSNNAACAASPTDRFMFTSSNLVAFPRFGHLYATAQMPPIRTLSSAARWCVICGRYEWGSRPARWHLVRRVTCHQARGHYQSARFPGQRSVPCRAPVNLSILCDSPGRTPHHSHSIVRVEPNELICHCKNLSALKTRVARTVRCARLLNSKRNLIAPENLRFQRLSLSIGRLFSNQPAAPHRRHSRRLPSAARVERSRLGFRPDYGKRRRRSAARQSRDMDIPARSGAYAASLRDTNSVKSRTRFVLRVSPDILLQLIP